MVQKIRGTYEHLSDTDIVNLILKVDNVDEFKTKLVENKWHGSHIVGNIFTLHYTTKQMISNLVEDENVLSMDISSPVHLTENK